MQSRWQQKPLAHSRSSKQCLLVLWGKGGWVCKVHPTRPLCCLPFIICELVSVVIRGNDVHEKNVLRFGIQAGHLHFVTGKHPPRREGAEAERQRQGINANIMKIPSTHFYEKNLRIF